MGFGRKSSAQNATPDLGRKKQISLNPGVEAGFSLSWGVQNAQLT